MRYSWLIFVWTSSQTLLLGSGFSSLPSLHFSRSVATCRGLDQTCFLGAPQFARATLPGQTRPRRVVPRVSMDTEGELFAGDDMFTAQVTKVSTPSGWDEVQRIAEENSLFILAEFRQEFCRKCMAIAPRFRKLPALLAGRSVMVVEVDAMKLGKPARVEMGIKVVPTFRFYKDGEVLEQIVAKRDLSETMVAVVEMVNRLAPSEYSEDNRNIVTKLQAEFGEGVKANPNKRTRLGHAPPGSTETKVDGDAFSAWRRAQSERVVRAPGTSQAKGTDTGSDSESLLRGIKGANGAQAPNSSTTLCAPSPRSRVGLVAEDSAHILRETGQGPGREAKVDEGTGHVGTAGASRLGGCRDGARLCARLRMQRKVGRAKSAFRMGMRGRRVTGPSKAREERKGCC